MVEKKEIKRKTHRCYLLYTNCKLGRVVVIRRDRDSPDQIPILLVVSLALNMKHEHSRILVYLISWIPFVEFKISDLLLHFPVSHLQSNFIGSGLVKINKQNIRM